MKNKRGCISFHKDFFRDDESLNMMSEVFSSIGFVTVFIEEKFNTKQYFGHSNRFDEIEEGEVVPMYDVIIQESNDITNHAKYCINIKRLS